MNPNCKFSRISSGSVTRIAPCLLTSEALRFPDSLLDLARQNFSPLLKRTTCCHQRTTTQSASTTSTPLLRPLIMRFLRGNCKQGVEHRGEIPRRERPPVQQTGSQSGMTAGMNGIKSIPNTAMLTPFTCKAALCATPSIHAPVHS